jgi:hypothetical protein
MNYDGTEVVANPELQNCTQVPGQGLAALQLCQAGGGPLVSDTHIRGQ